MYQVSISEFEFYIDHIPSCCRATFPIAQLPALRADLLLGPEQQVLAHWFDRWFEDCIEF